MNIKILRSPVDRSKLTLLNNNFLKDKSGNKFVIKNSIPRFVDSKNYANFGKQWSFFRKTQLDKFNKTTISKDRFFNDTNGIEKN